VWPRRSSRLVVSTHLDDAVFSCFAAVARADAVVTVFAAVPPAGILGDWDAATSATTSAARVRERRAEDRAALALVGAAAVHLDLLELQHAEAGGLCGPSADDVEAALAPYLSSADVVHAPAGIGHPEHRVVRDAILRRRPDAILYADVPYVLRADARLEIPDEPPGARAIRTELLDAPLFALKTAACRCYATQLEKLVELHGNFLHDDGLARERAWVSLDAH
jgi:LmbE family N-acetylglucosaminyl deacetylase